MKLILVVLLLVKICQCAVNKYHYDLITTTETSSSTIKPVEKGDDGKLSSKAVAAINPIANNVEDIDGSNKEKRCPQELLQSVHKVILKRRELNQDMLKKKCQSCRESILCKVDNCSHCQMVCNGIENDVDQIVQMKSRANTDDAGSNVVLTAKDNRYFTVGAFTNDAVRKLILRLLNVQNADSVARLIVLAEMRGKGNGDNKETNVPKKPLIIDTARVLGNSNSTKLEFVKQDVRDSISKDHIRIVNGINVELDDILRAKKQNGEGPHLTAVDVEEAINKALAVIDAAGNPQVGSKKMQELENALESRESGSDEDMQIITHLPPTVPKPLPLDHKVSPMKQLPASSKIDESESVAATPPSTANRMEQDSILNKAKEGIAEKKKEVKPKDERKPDQQLKPSAAAQSFEEYQKMLKILKENISKLPEDQQTDVKRLIENQPREASDALLAARNAQDIDDGASRKLTNEGDVVGIKPLLHKKYHAKLQPTRLNTYGNKYGKAINKKGYVGNPQENAEGSPNVVGNTPSLIDSTSADEKMRPPFVDPKLLNMNSVVEDLRQAPNTFLDRTSKLLNILKTNRANEPLNNQVVGEANQVAENNAKEAGVTAQGENEEEVGCSKESEEIPILIHQPLPSYGYKPGYYREAEDNAKENVVGATNVDEQERRPQVPNTDGPMNQPPDNGLVSAQMDWSPNEPLPDSLAPNSHLFGKFVPDKKTAVIDHKYNLKHKPNNMYYVGENVKLPVLMKQHNDGSYHIAVDVDKLCNCKDGNCTGVVGHGKAQPNNELEQIKMPLPDPLNKRIAESIKKRSVDEMTYANARIPANTLLTRGKDISNEEDDIKYKFDNKDDGFAGGDPIINRLQFAKKMLEWAKRAVNYDERQ